MKSTELKKLIKEAVKEAIQEEMKDILLEAVKSPSGAVVGNQGYGTVTETPAATNPETQKASRPQMMSQLMYNAVILNMSSADANTFQVPRGTNTTGEGSALPSGNVGLDQIMGLMNK